ncbi:MAG TPA: universal stress protein [Ktedonobacteraceae bacterium]|nr:universal stress protein [Ktedonobacteraceae bacterium]
MFQHILIPLDGSARAEQALPVAVQIARASGGSIVLLQIVSPPVDYGGMLAAGELLAGGIIESEIAEATSYLKRIAASDKLAGVTTISEVLYGPPAQNILTYAETQEIDLIVLCSHGRTGFKQWVLGSVAHRLVHQSTVPLLVLNERQLGNVPLHSDAKRPFRAFIPLDGSPLAERAILPAAHLAAALAAPARGTVHFAQVVRLYPTTAKGSFVDAFNERAIENARVYLTQLVDRLQATMTNLKLTFSWSIACENGDTDVATTLLNMAEHGERGKEASDEGTCDLIAISTHGRDAVERWVIGSVTERLLDSTKLPMLIMPPQKVRQK